MKRKMLHMLIACLALATPSHGQQHQNPPGFINIDCGAPYGYYDDTLSLYYNNDSGFLDSGTNMYISTQYNNDNIRPQMKSIRIFPNGTRNCYTLKPDQGKGHKYLIRAEFWYADYDGKNQTPTFELYIDVNYWAKTGFSYDFYEEIIYTPPRDYIQVCLVNIGQGVPFISSLELRLLNDSIYPVNSGALYTYRRYSLGSTYKYRYPQDNYDRLWNGITYSNSNGTGITYSGNCSLVSNTTIMTSTSNDDYKVPLGVLMTAEQVQNVNDSLSLSCSSCSPTATWYVYFHFAELQLGEGKHRELETYVENEFVKSVNLDNLKPTTVVSLPFNGSYPDFTVKATAQSSLPPLLNAFELFYVLELPNSPTILNDFNAMYGIKTTYEVAIASWQGDPCVPSQFLWNQVNCSYDGSPRIVSLSLSSTGLKGLISQSFYNLTALVSLDLSNNQLTGLVPEFFAQMSSLKILNLSRNNFNGSVPQALLNRVADGSLQLSLEGNSNLCQSDPCTTNVTVVPTKTKSTNIAAIIEGICLGIVLLIVLAVFWRNKRRRDHAETAKTLTSGASNRNLRAMKNQPFNSTEITRITNYFQTIIGEGAFGNVYLGHLVDGDRDIQVAVKLLSQSSKQGYKEFHAEVQLLMVVHHRNLVSLIGYCEESEYMALIYEFMSNGNVRQHLSENNPNVLSWMQRLQIAIDTAQGLEYLHNGCKPPIIHRDLKTSNILLNENMRAKIADFGLSKAFVTDLDSHITTCPAGTPGYLDPEFHTSGNLNKKSDVYSFGVVLFELITGKPPIVRSQKGSVHIPNWVTPFVERGDIHRIIDSRLQGQVNTGSAWKAVEIAMSCVSTLAVQRSEIDWVLSELKECLVIEVSSGSRQRSGSSKWRSDSFKMTYSDLDMIPNAR